MNTIFNTIDNSIIDFWKSNKLKEEDFYCRDCGNLLIDLNEIKNVCYVTKSRKNKKAISSPYFMYKGEKGRARYVESEYNRWCIIGRDLSGKLYFRHLCWKCFFKKLRATEDIARKARKSKWYAKVLNNENPIPPPWTSPSTYYKLLFDITDDELNKERSKFDTASLSSFIRRYGKNDGKKRYEDYRKRQAYTCSKEYMKETRGWSDDKWNEFNKSRASTEDNFINRYGSKLGKSKWKKYCTNEAYAGCTLQYFVDKYGKDEGTKKYLEVNAKKTISLENFIAKYGEEIGVKKFNSIKNKGYSLLSQQLFLQLDKLLGNYAINSKYATKNNEETISLFFDDGTCKICHPDYILNTKIIEFNGNFWHANPLFYTENDKINVYNQIRNVKDIWLNDYKRKQALEKLGYKIKVVWEKDYIDNKEKTIEDCINFLKS